jgi:hypothetical protein
LVEEGSAWAQPGKMAVMLLAPMVQNVSETDRTPANLNHSADFLYNAAAFRRVPA